MAWIEPDMVGGVWASAADDLKQLVLNITFPRSFNMSVMSLELREGDKPTGLTKTSGSVLDLFTFPVNPNGITKVEPVITNIKKTFTGISVIKTEDFIPQTITIRGDFGYDWKFSLTDLIYGVKALTNISSIEEQLYYTVGGGPSTLGFNNGFGCTKRMQGIIERAAIQDGDIPRNLYLHNYFLSESYLVEPKNLTYSQDISRNKIWTYEAVFDIVDHIDGYRHGLKGLYNPSSIATRSLSAASKIVGKLFDSISI
jgi:hypothetical protein